MGNAKQFGHLFAKKATCQPIKIIKPSFLLLPMLWQQSEVATSLSNSPNTYSANSLFPYYSDLTFLSSAS